MKNLLLVALLVLTFISCTKEKYPMEMENFKATDCTYSLTTPVKETDTIINFRYVSDEVQDKEYKKKIYVGYCKLSDVNWRESVGIDLVYGILVDGEVYYGEDLEPNTHTAEFLLIKRATITYHVITILGK